MAVIEANVFGSETDNSLVLYNEEWGRNLAIGSNWQRLRIGALVSIDPNGINNISFAGLRCGISVGASDHLGSGAPSLWYGVNYGGFAQNLNGTTYTYRDVGGYAFFHCDTFSLTESYSGIMSGPLYAGYASFPISNGTYPRRWPIFVEFRKDGTNLKVSAAGPNLNQPSIATDVQQDFALWQLVEGLEDDTTFMDNLDVPYFTGYDDFAMAMVGTTTYTNYPTKAGLVGEVIAPQIGWNKAAQGLRVYAIGVSRLPNV